MFRCRTCLETPADKHISELGKGLRCNKNCFEIMAFCLNIEVTQDSKITTNLCRKCYRKVITFYKFKTVSLKNDSYLKSLDPVLGLETQKLLDEFGPGVESYEPLCVVQKVESSYVSDKAEENVMKLNDQKIPMIADENEIKHEHLSDTDKFGPSLAEDSNEGLKIEIGAKRNYSLEDVEVDVNYGDPLEGLSLVEDCNEGLKIEIDAKKDDSLEDFESDVKYKDTLEGKEPENEPNDEPLHIAAKDKYTKDSKRKEQKKRSRPRRVKSQKQENTNQKLQVCEECGKSVRNLRDHALQHVPKEERRRVQCKACPKTFATFSGRHNHYKYAHLGLKPECDICNKVVRCLKVHKMQVHSPNTLPYGCVSCERRYVTQSALDVHMVAHTKDPKFECDICEKKFRLKHLVLNHIKKVHENEKNYQCDVCAKPFFEKVLLQRHAKTHSKKRLYKCSDCGQALKTKDTLKSHLLLHRTNKKYACEQCSKSFQKLDYLKVHMVTHTKEKPYGCRYCNVRFGRSHHRSRHEATAHQIQKKAE